MGGNLSPITTPHWNVKKQKKEKKTYHETVHSGIFGGLYQNKNLINDA